MPEIEYTKHSVIDNKYSTVLNGFHSTKAFGPNFRLKQLRNLYHAIEQNEEKLKTALFTDLHRPHQETEVLELNECLAECALAIDNLEQWLKPQPIAGVFEDVRFAAGESLIRKTPYGAVLIIGPWNYPFLLIFAPIISAIAAGNSVLLKPSELCVNSTLAITEVLESALDPTIFQIVQGGIDETTYLLEKKWDKIMLTGSPKVGKVVAAAAAKHLTPVLLELGGKSPAIITSKADLPLAAKRLAWAKLVNAGQTCIAPDYVLIDSEIADEFTFHFKNAVKLFYPDMDSQSDSKDFAHILNERLFDRLEKLVGESNGYVWQWGEPNKETLFYPPTVVRNVRLDDSLMQEELFAPILPIIESDDIMLAAPEIITDYHDHPLALYMFTTDKEEQEMILRHTRSGAVMINDALVQGGSPAIPFGGVGTSGVGRYHGKYGFDEFTYDRPVVSQPNWSEALLKARYPPYTEGNAKMIKFVSRPQNYDISKEGPVKRNFTLKTLAASYVAAPVLLGIGAVMVKLLHLFN